MPPVPQACPACRPSSSKVIRCSPVPSRSSRWRRRSAMPIKFSANAQRKRQNNIMTLKIIGMARSRTVRTLWMANELGLQYAHVETPLGAAGSRTPAHLAINPNGHIPVIDDDGLILWESLAINLYLARKHGGPLAPVNIAEEGEILQWALWQLCELERNAANTLYHSVMYPPEQRDLKILAQALEGVKAPLQVLETALAKGGGHLVGNRFTVADLNLVGAIFYL
ncbi:MAG: glutathione S-transferase family protein, partial [Acetobacteraceae bacterium]|nr:glutathione S-transferase family protein [Acetobacteraceae bacterium]